MITLELKGVEPLIRKLERSAKEIESGAAIGISFGAAFLHQEVLKAIREVGAVASTDLLQSVTTSPVSITATGLTASVGSNSPYAEVVERGRRAGSRMPPRDRILQWMVMKGLEPSQAGAYLIARKIARDGIIGKHPFQKGAERATGRINTLVGDAIRAKLQAVYRHR